MSLIGGTKALGKGESKENLDAIEKNFDVMFVVLVRWMVVWMKKAVNSRMP